MTQHNFNDTVWVRLTPAGREALADYWSEYPPKYRGSPREEDGWSEFQLWELMQIFGPHMYMAGQQVFVGNVFRLEART